VTRGPLHDAHAAAGGRMVDFAGWDMPLQFSGVVAEHTAVRERVGLFDVSHLGKVLVTGPDAGALVDHVVTGAVAGLEAGRARYGLCLTPEGGIVDDLFVYRRVSDFLVVPNAANTKAVQASLAASREAGGFEAEIAEAALRWAILALQGPDARAMAEELLPGATELKLHRFREIELDGAVLQVARTGYTGEYGFELFVPWDDAPRIWDLLLKAGAPRGILPIGLGARDTLRLEMGYPLHGHEISVNHNPVEAGLSWAVAWDKPAFTGREAILAVREAGPSRRLVGLRASGPGIPRAGQRVLSGSEEVGELTSGNFSPTLKTGIALGYVTAAAAEPGTMLHIDVRGKQVPATVVVPPFVARGRAAAGG